LFDESHKEKTLLFSKSLTALSAINVFIILVRISIGKMFVYFLSLMHTIKRQIITPKEKRNYLSMTWMEQDFLQ